MAFENIKFPENERDPERMETRDLAWYECAGCGEHWKDAERDRAVRRGEWRDREGGVELFTHLKRHRPKKIGFHIPAWLSPFVALSECAAAFLKGLKDKAKLKDFQNNYKAEPWVVYEKQREEDRILALCDDRPKGSVPGGGVVAALTAGVDTQDDGFWYEIRAWGFGLTQESWQIREGFVTTFEDLERVLWGDQYLDATGKGYSVMLVVQDAMGHRTSDVYDFCRGHRGKIIPLKGTGRKNQPITWSNQEFYPNSKKPIPGGLKLALTDVGYFKDKLSSRLEISAGDPGAWHYHTETTAEWARHMVAEYVDEKGNWECPPSRPNHGWDCSVYNLVAAEIKGIRFFKQAAVKKDPSPRPAAAGSNWVTGGRNFRV